jgi:decaprenyl-phosphate phosphoribosyltransferase
MAQVFRFVLESARPRQWLKNFALFAALIFSGQLFFLESLFKVVFAFFIFCFLTSSVYLFNDVVDAPTDRRHPFKKRRPIASGKLPMPLALFIAVVGFFLSLSLARGVSFFFFLASLSYLILHIFYTLWLKHVPILDLLAIAAGFIIRVYAGALVINVHMNVWFLLTVVSLSLFLAVGKRQSERTLLQDHKHALLDQRATLISYSPRLLDVYTSMFANATWITYALFTFLQPQPVFNQPRVIGLLAELPHTFVTQKWLMVSVPIVVYGVMRYLQLIYEKNEGESPDKILLSDKPLLASVVLWGITVIGIIYGVG